MVVVVAAVVIFVCGSYCSVTVFVMVNVLLLFVVLLLFLLLSL